MRGGPVALDPGRFEEVNREHLAAADEAERKAAALREWARRVRLAVEHDRAALRNGWTMTGPPSLRQVEAGMRRRKPRSRP